MRLIEHICSFCLLRVHIARSYADNRRQKKKVVVVLFVNVKNITARPLGFDIVVATSVRDAVAGAGSITTCTADKTQAAGRTRDD